MCAFALFLSVDPSLGRVDYSLLSDQTLMEMLIEGFDDETKNKYKHSNGMYFDVCEWPCIECDADERIIEIDIDSEDVSGSLEIRSVPPKVKVLDISSWCNSQLTGSVDLANLPDEMQKLSIRHNRITGEVDLTQLPDGMHELSLGCNKLTGEIDLAQLPDVMQELSLNNNEFSGEIDLTHLPDKMQKLSLENNQFTGEIDLARLPSVIEYLFLNNNQLTGPLVIKKLPQRVIDVRGNHFNAISVVDSKIHATIKLEGSGVASVVDENGGEQDMQRFLK